jgi:hypothetical protein
MVSQAIMRSAHAFVFFTGPLGAMFAAARGMAINAPACSSRAQGDANARVPWLVSPEVGDTDVTTPAS